MMWRAQRSRHDLRGHANEEEDYLLSELSRECEHAQVPFSLKPAGQRKLSRREIHRKLRGTANGIIGRQSVKGSRLEAMPVPSVVQKSSDLRKWLSGRELRMAPGSGRKRIRELCF